MTRSIHVHGVVTRVAVQPVGASRHNPDAVRMASRIAAGLEQKFPGTFGRAQSPAPEPSNPEQGVYPAPPAGNVGRQAPIPQALPEPVRDGSVPDNHLIALQRERQLRQERETELRDARRELERAKDKASRGDIMQMLAQAERPAGFDEYSPEKQTMWFSAQAAREQVREQFGADGIEAVQRMSMEHTVMKAIPGLSGAQVEAIGEVLAQASGLTPIEAAHVAMARSPDLFPTAAPEAAETAVSSAAANVARPGRGGSGREPSDPVKESYNQLYAAEGYGERRNASVNVIRAKLAQHLAGM